MLFSFTFTLLTLVCAASASWSPFSRSSRRDTSSNGSLAQGTDPAAGQQGTLAQGTYDSNQYGSLAQGTSDPNQYGSLAQQQARAYLAQTVLRRNLFPNGSPYTPEEQRRLGEMGILIARQGLGLADQENAPYYGPPGFKVPLLGYRGLDFTRRSLRPLVRPFGSIPDLYADSDLGLARRGRPSVGFANPSVVFADMGRRNLRAYEQWTTGNTIPIIALDGAPLEVETPRDSPCKLESELRGLKQQAATFGAFSISIACSWRILASRRREDPRLSVSYARLPLAAGHPLPSISHADSPSHALLPPSPVYHRRRWWEAGARGE
ncbi:unnamed protein product [Peniophora sp. CBMAI 1063]|nr:unnamed protein product [Peniophora sp. CBMAI 1063]